MSISLTLVYFRTLSFGLAFGLRPCLAQFLVLFILFSKKELIVIPSLLGICVMSHETLTMLGFVENLAVVFDVGKKQSYFDIQILLKRNYFNRLLPVIPPVALLRYCLLYTQILSFLGKLEPKQLIIFGVLFLEGATHVCQNCQESRKP